MTTGKQRVEKVSNKILKYWMPYFAKWRKAITLEKNKPTEILLKSKLMFFILTST